MFLDKFCLNDGEPWERGFLEGLEHAAVVVLILSNASMDTLAKHATTRQDNVLLEIEYALEKYAKGTAKVLPVVLERDFDFSREFPDAMHNTNKSRHNIKETMRSLFALQSIIVEGVSIDLLGNILSQVDVVSEITL